MQPAEHHVQRPNSDPIDYDRHRRKAILLRRAARAAAVGGCLGAMQRLVSTRFRNAIMVPIRRLKEGSAGE